MSSRGRGVCRKYAQSYCARRGRSAPNDGRKNLQISDLSFVQDAENTPECERMLAFCAGQRYNANNESDCVKFRKRCANVKGKRLES